MSYGYITRLDERVERQHVRYNNRYGTAIAADVYTAKDLDKSKKHPALIPFDKLESFFKDNLK